jgi:potassium-transporting ATPase KdpC subunit
MIKKEIITALKVFLFFAVLMGIVYPLGITAVAQITMPYQANGSLIVANGRTVGSTLIGQGFDRPEYFHSRPSAVNYDAAGSGASNLAPSSRKLVEEVVLKLKVARAENNIPADTPVPADMVLASASGLDPHISVDNAMLQVVRVAHERNLPEDRVKKLVKASTDYDFFGLWGQAGVNVLKLNLALDTLAGR